MAQKDLEAKVAAIDKELTRLKDIEAIRRLENAYSYYLAGRHHARMAGGDVFQEGRAEPLLRENQRG